MIHRPLAVPAAGILALAILAASCSGPSHEYVRNTSLRTAFKVPSEWTLYDKQTFFGIPPGPPSSTPDPIRWLVAIDGNPAPAVSHILNPSALDTDYPQGIALVQEFSVDDRDQSSIRAVRDYLFPVTALIQDPNIARMLSYDDTIDRDGVHGVRAVFQFQTNALAAVATQPADGESDLQRALLGGSGAPLLSRDYVTVDQMAFVDAETSRIYYMAVMCSAECFDRNRTEIQSIVDSWTVLP